MFGPTVYVLLCYRGRSQDAITKALDKAKANGFYLGLERNWLDLEVAE